MNGHINGTSNGHFNGYTNDHHGEEDGFLDRLHQILITEGVQKATDRKTKIVDFKHPKELMNLIDLEIRDEPESDETLLSLCSETIKYSVKTGHPRFFNQLYGGQDQYGLGGAWLTETLNTSQYTFEVAPVFTLMEQVVLQKMAKILGFENGDGIFCPGGSISNMYGLSLARYYCFPEIKSAGMQALPKLCILTSDQSHYSVRKGAAFLGIGMNNVRDVKSDSRGKMIPKELEKEIVQAKKEGFTPFLVNATAGTTVVGAYDPINDIAVICEKYGIWLHVDAAWGGGALLSKKYQPLFHGIHRADSVAWNPHKMIGAPLQCCAFLTRNRGLLQEAHCANASYLFQQDKFYDISYDTGDKSVQCGRKVDVFKLWLMWKARGDSGFEDGINRIFEISQYFTQKIKEMEGFRIVYPEPECTNVCFWYIPLSLRGQVETPEWWAKLGMVAPKLKERMVYAGTMLIGYQPLGDLVNFFRIVFVSSKVNEDDVNFVLNEFHRLGSDL